MCAFCMPINAMNRPIPTDTATLMDAGIMLKIASRTLKIDRKMKIIPSANTAARATCQE